MIERTVTHSTHFNKVKYYYEHNLWNIDRVRQAVVKGWITEAEFFEICHEPY